MTQEPQPLTVGATLAGRFEVERVLGRGGFGIAYLAQDLVRHDHATLKELAPLGCLRSESGLLDLETGGVSSHRLRQSFLDEARILSRLSIPGILPMRAVFTENGTAYYATDHLPHSETLERLLMKEGRMDQEGAMDILFQLLETLEAVHQKGILHRDIKPSNVLISPKGQAYLIDFGAAREWHADEATRHTVLYTPGYAPIEQLSERGRRGPATDIYALCATAYRMLAGSTPVPATDRVNGVELTALRTVRPDLDGPLASALEAGLRMRYHDRPQSVADLREMLNEVEPEPEPGSLAAYDAKLVRLQRFGYEKRQCPSCGGVLEQPKPLRKWGCPVCRDGMIRRRDISMRLCPACQIGTLHRRLNDRPLAYCPICRIGLLARRSQGVIRKKVFLDCLSCKSSFETVDGGVRVISSGARSGETRTAQEWRETSHRALESWMCDGCDAQYDVMEDGRWEQITPEPRRYHALYPEEWARVAAGLPPGAGNAVCDVCRADYFVDDSRLTLLTTEVDPHRFASEHLGRLLDLENVRWLGVGKHSPEPGYVCADCGLEFDFEGEYLRLVKSSNRLLVRHVGEPKKLVDWHRVALGLPEVHDEHEFRTDALTAVRYAYESGEIGFDPKNTTLWKGAATRNGRSGTLQVSRTEISFGGMLKRWKAPLDALLDATASGDSLALTFSGEEGSFEFEVAPVELSVQLESGNQTVVLGAECLAKRLNASRKRAPAGRR